MLDLSKLKYPVESKVREAFYPSDFGKSDLEIYLSMRGIGKTNPPKWNETLKWGAGIGVEDKMMEVLKYNGVIHEFYDQLFDGRVEMEREGVVIHGYIDGMNKTDEPIEIKSINNKNFFDIKSYKEGKPRSNYVGQLAVYMDFLGKEIGYLFVASVDGLNTFWLVCRKFGDGKYRCGEIEVDINAEYKKWSNIKKLIKEKKMPNIFQHQYKYPLESIDWRSVSKTAISKARNNSAVIGDWQVQYSDWKDLIVKLQGTSLGYTNKELLYIHEQTKGYTTWK